MMMKKLGKLKSKVLGSVSYENQLVERELAGGSLIVDKAHADIEQIVDKLEKNLS